jgi:ribulose-5-phosphate 4-epimerase/fuculose-1-phosphate aldolase
MQGQPASRPAKVSARPRATVLLSLALALTSVGSAPPPAAAQAPANTAGPVEPALIDDLVAASRILVDQGVLDGFGHVSMRHPKDPARFLMSRSLATALVTAADIVEHDLDGNGVDAKGRNLFLERFIHAEVYRARPDVKAVVHSHSPALIPFGITKVPLRPVYHNSAFLGAGVPVFEIRQGFAMTDMLVRNGEIGKALAGALGDKPVVLMRGHGNVVVGPSVQMAVFRAIYTEVNARLQTQATILGGPITFLESEEAAKADKINEQVHGRPWELWKQKAMPK